MSKMMLAAIVALIASAATSRAAATLIHVSVQGRDEWDGRAATQRAGTQTGPLATLVAARDRVRALRESGAIGSQPAVIQVSAGTYVLDESFVLEGQDSGTADAPITWRASGEVLLLGGRPVTEWTAVTDHAVRARLPEGARMHVRQCDLRMHGVLDLGQISPGGFGKSGPATHLGLSFNGKTMRVARWPNEEWALTGAVPKGKQITDESGKPRGTDADRFAYLRPRPSQWKNTGDIWMHGYWFRDWADRYLKVARIDKAKKQIVIAPPQSGFGYRKGARHRFLNVLEELDSPGEYYVDRTSGLLYFWPPDAGGAAIVSVLQDPMVDLRDVSHVRLRGFTFSNCRGDAISVSGGEQVRIENCTVRNVGNAGVVIDGGKGHSLLNSHIAHLGGNASAVSGGDRQTLTPCNHKVENCDIHDFGEWFRTYRVGILMRGVGIRIRHNDVHDAPHAGIHYKGNDHLIEFNDIYRVCNDADDVGAVYTGRDWSMRGTTIRHNYIHHLGGGMGHVGSIGIYLDDLASGQAIVGNIIQDVQKGIQHCGGRDNIFENNIFVGCSVCGIHVNTRTWAHKLIRKAQGSWDMEGLLKRVPFDREPYASRYPELVKILDEEPLNPRNNLIRRNIFWQCKQALRIDAGHENRPEWHRIEKNLTNTDPRFTDAANGNFVLRNDSPAPKMGFESIPVEKIGRQAQRSDKEMPSR